ncbi:MAG: S41 family peptidase [Alphaproteobacteria bacterium]|nr:MAG: S41 family peptidase [Alphaproteobacteria bacterium]
MKKLLLGVAIGTFSTAVILTVPVAPTANGGTANASSTSIYRQLDLFGDVYEQIRTKYVEEVDDEALMESAIDGMMSSLDPHSSYLSPDAFTDMEISTSGEFGGLGIEVTMDKDMIKVVAPIDDTPASRAGIQPGDHISHVDGVSIIGMSMSDAIDKMRGPKGTSITITVVRGDEPPFELTLERAVIAIDAVRSRVIDNVGYIRIATFSRKADAGVQKAMAQMRKELGSKMEGVVIDLRSNPGGLLDQAVAISDDFLERGEIVSTSGRNPRDSQRHNARPGDLAEGLPIVILIDGGSASASEIVAGALRDHRRATLIGTNSFGKGTVQTVIPLNNGNDGALRLTTAKYYTPSGQSIHEIGIAPDIEVKFPEPELDQDGQPIPMDDIQLDKALETIHGLNGSAHQAAAVVSE